MIQTNFGTNNTKNTLLHCPVMNNNIVSQRRHLIACSHCGYMNSYIGITPGCASHCRRCKHVLYYRRRQWLTRANALLITGFILFFCANAFDFIGLEAGSNAQSSTLLSGAVALYNNEQSLLALLVLLIIFLFPLLELSLLGYILLSVSTHYKAPGISTCLTLLAKTRPWNMLEIFLVSVLVTSVKLGDTASVIIGPGVISFAMLVVTLIALNLQLDHGALWHWYRRENLFCLSDDQKFHSCTTCQALIGRRLWQQSPHCPRCHQKVSPRLPNSLQKTTALTIAAAILYIPAITMPMMSITTFGQTNEQTLLSGIIHLYQDGLWFIGSVVLVASIVVPIAKLGIMTYLCWSTYRGSSNNQPARLTLYRLTEIIGRWSMIDVFVIALLVALVQFGILMSIVPESAALAFASVVVLTMFAADTFDPRLIWDTNERRT